MPTGTTPAGRISTNFGSYMPEVTGTPWNPQPPHRRQTQDSPNTEVTTPQNGTQTSVFGDPPTTRRTWKLQAPNGILKPPPSATNPGFAEDGGYMPGKQDPNLHHRRPTNYSPKTAVRPPQNRFPNLRHRRPIHRAPKTEVTDPENRSQTSTIGEPRNPRRRRKLDHPKTGSQNFRLRRPSNYSPKTEVTGTEQREK